MIENKEAGSSLLRGFPGARRAHSVYAGTTRRWHRTMAPISGPGARAPGAAPAGGPRPGGERVRSLPEGTVVYDRRV